MRKQKMRKKKMGPKRTLNEMMRPKAKNKNKEKERKDNISFVFIWLYEQFDLDVQHTRATIDAYKQMGHTDHDDDDDYFVLVVDCNKFV